MNLIGNKIRRFLVLIVLLAVTAAGCSNEKQYVSDYENILDSSKEMQLNKLVRNHEIKTSKEVAILTTRGFGADTTIEAFALNTFNNVGIGKQDKNNGVLIVLSASLREVRIATGFGTEKVLTDSIAKRIIDSAMAPHFRAGAYFDGLLSGTKAITNFLERPGNQILATRGN